MHIDQQIALRQTHLPHLRGKVGMGVRCSNLIGIRFRPLADFNPHPSPPPKMGGK